MTMTYRKAAVKALEECGGPMHYRDLAKTVVKDGLVDISSADAPEMILGAIIAADIKQKGKSSEFIRIRPGVFELRKRHERTDPDRSALKGNDSEEKGAADNMRNMRVRISSFPVYSELRCLLSVWNDRPRKQVTNLRTTIEKLRGTLQKTVNWTEPEKWIQDRLNGNDRDLARVIWEQSKGSVNPRYIYGHWLLARNYDLLQEDEGILHLTETGQDFQKNPDGEAVADIDEKEGLIKMLSIVAHIGPVRAKGIVEEWADYLARHSSFSKESVVKLTMRSRLNNLVKRGLIERKGNLYSVISEGRAHLNKNEDFAGEGEYNESLGWIQQREKAVRESIRELLLDMDPIAFEHLIKQLLEKMGYQNVDVTASTRDGGVDVVGDIEMGISSIREAIQVKRHRQPIPRKIVAELRGSLHRFNAFRGSIITTSRFTKGAREEVASEKNVAPITLMDGDELIDRLIEHNIGVRRRTIVMEIDTDAFFATVPKDD